MSKENNIAVCGLVCSDCKIYKAPNNPEIAKELVAYFEGQWENVKMEDFHRNGCRDVLNCWSSDCGFAIAVQKIKIWIFVINAKSFPARN